MTRRHETVTVIATGKPKPTPVSRGVNGTCVRCSWTGHHRGPLAKTGPCQATDGSAVTIHQHKGKAGGVAMYRSIGRGGGQGGAWCGSVGDTNSLSPAPTQPWLCASGHEYCVGKQIADTDAGSKGGWKRESAYKTQSFRSWTRSRIARGPTRA